MVRCRLMVWLLLALCVCSGARHEARAQNERGEKATRARVARPAPTGEVTITLSEKFFNSFLDEVFTELNRPTYKISGANTGQKDESEASAAHVSSSGAGRECVSVVVLEREMDGVRTSVRFENGRIIAPLAFSGSYGSTLLGCLNFQGWADTTMKLEFDAERQVVNARVNVKDIHVSNVPKLASSVLVGMVQRVVDSRINPVEILQAGQLSTRVTVAAAGGALRLRAKEVRPEVINGALQLHILYEFLRAE